MLLEDGLALLCAGHCSLRCVSQVLRLDLLVFDLDAQQVVGHVLEGLRDARFRLFFGLVHRKLPFRIAEGLTGQLLNFPVQKRSLFVELQGLLEFQGLGQLLRAL